MIPLTATNVYSESSRLVLCRDFWWWGGDVFCTLLDGVRRAEGFRSKEGKTKTTKQRYSRRGVMEPRDGEATGALFDKHVSQNVVCVS